MALAVLLLWLLTACLQTQCTACPWIFSPNPSMPPEIPIHPLPPGDAESGRRHNQDPLHSDALPSLCRWLGGVVWPTWTWLPAVSHGTQGSGSAETEDTPSVINEKAITRDEDDKAAKCYLGPVLIAGLNHFPLPANGMHNCAGFPGVLHPYVFRLVTDALPWKPALGKRTIPGTVGSGRMQAPIWSLQLVSKN